MSEIGSSCICAPENYIYIIFYVCVVIGLRLSTGKQRGFNNNICNHQCVNMYN